MGGFLDNEQDTTLVQKILNQYDYHEKYGYKLFTVDADDLSYEAGSKRLEEWLKTNNIICLFLFHYRLSIFLCHNMYDHTCLD